MVAMGYHNAITQPNQFINYFLIRDAIDKHFSDEQTLSALVSVLSNTARSSGFAMTALPH